MKQLIATCLILALFPLAAEADVWKWVDAEGNTRFVTTKTPIYWWMDEAGNVQYSDSPDHEDAVAVELVWHSSGRLDEAVREQQQREAAGDPETSSDRLAREAAEQKYCERVTEIYESYKNAPKLYRTGDNGEKEFLNKRETRKMIRDVKGKRDKLCR